MKKSTLKVVTYLNLLFLYLFTCLSDDRFTRYLSVWSRKILSEKRKFIGFPVDQSENVDLDQFIKYANNIGIDGCAANNCGDPFIVGSAFAMNTHAFEREVVKYFATNFCFSDDNYWGFVTYSGTDGNNQGTPSKFKQTSFNQVSKATMDSIFLKSNTHLKIQGIYMGRKYLASKSDSLPVIYANREAHHSIARISDLQNTEIRLVNTTHTGQMDLVDFRQKLDTSRPALIVLCIGTTFKGAIDDQKTVIGILKAHHRSAVYIHLDAALFGGFIPFLNCSDKTCITQNETGFHSISVSGHKFFNLKEPMGVFVSTRSARKALKDTDMFVNYLRASIPTISCSRSALSPLKFWWLINRKSREDFSEIAADLMRNSKYLHERLLSVANTKAWRNPNSNIVFFERPSEEIVQRYALVCVDQLAHVCVMQHVTKNIIDEFISDMTHWKCGSNVIVNNSSSSS